MITAANPDIVDGCFDRDTEKLFGQHLEYNNSELIPATIMKYNIRDQLGYDIFDNHKANNHLIEEFEFDPKKCHIHYIIHIINLIIKTLLKMI
ncbi:hypothetical protein BC938DRAFT_473560 [Jimgerdemannia flammicorona]|uniref:Uncharacterized protein n=1 Tax=Jimgerdemannia flammicorona TaxID=994334 RepID=A0A433Q3T3_9FUNG|nr:hypothetical protein BC938DRAFT_473560 [Jimgerdemannia flammicorona]